MYQKEVVISGENNGYLYLIDPDHPLAMGNSGMVYLHRHIMSVSVGRWLEGHEQVDHINGDRYNNDLSNLQILDAQAHGIKDAVRRGFTIHADIICPICGEEFHQSHARAMYCSPPCGREAVKKLRVSATELEALVWAMPTTKVAEQLNVSDAAIGKLCRKLGVEKPPRGYWAKIYAGKHVVCPRPSKP